MRTVRHSALWALALLAGLAAARAEEFSTSVMRPVAVDPATGMISGKLPGGGGPASYYFAVPLGTGELMAQLQITGRPNGTRRLTIELLGAEAKVAASTFVRAGFGPKDEATKGFPIDAAGRHLVRLT